MQSKVNLLGAVLNRVDLSADGYYEYGYRYGRYRYDYEPGTETTTRRRRRSTTPKSGTA
jgi:hypothetical protein